MKTVVSEVATGNVLNVGAGEPSREPPEGQVFDAVADDTLVGPGWIRQADGVYAAPIPPPPPPLTPAQMQEAWFSRVRAYIEDTARAHGYGKLYPWSPSMECAFSVNAPIPAIAANSQAFVAWRDRQLAYVDTLATQIAHGQAELPESEDALIAQMQATDPMVWPS